MNGHQHLTYQKVSNNLFLYSQCNPISSALLLAADFLVTYVHLQSLCQGPLYLRAFCHRTLVLFTIEHVCLYQIICILTSSDINWPHFLFNSLLFLLLFPPLVDIKVLLFEVSVALLDSKVCTTNRCFIE